MAEESFRDAPISLGERRARDDSSKWTPRELLVFLLREIDNKRWAPDGIVICSFTDTGPDGFCTGMRRSNTTVMQAVAMIELAKADLVSTSKS